MAGRPREEEGREAVSDRIGQLKSVCSTDPYRTNLHAPFSAEFWGAKWIVATDGHCLAAFQSEEELLADGTPPNIADAVGPTPATPKRKATLAALREWAGEVVSEECELCEGEGEYDEDCDCPNCNGTHQCKDCDGTGECSEIRYGRLGRSVLNRNLLSKVLKSAPAEGEVLIAKDSDMSPFILRSGDWMAAIMPIRPTAEEAKDCKVEFTAMEPVGG
jgi:hypothetical protein